ISDVLKQRIPMQRWPEGKELPENMTLSMIQGLQDGTIARLMELDIDNTQKLACDNAVLIWLRTSYKLELIVDWMAQAQLLRTLEADKVAALRSNGVRDIFCYVIAIQNDAGLTSIQRIINIPIEIIQKHRDAVA